AVGSPRRTGPPPAPWVPRPVDLHAFRHLGFRRSGSTANLAIGRARFLRLGGFDDRLRRATSEDVDLCWRAQLSGATLVHEPSAVVSYRAREHLAEAVRQSFGYGQDDAFLYRKFA